MDYEEITKALKRAAKGLTARQLMGECESFGDIQELVKALHKLKTEGVIKANGMRDSQVVYWLNDSPVAAKVVAPEPLPVAPPEPALNRAEVGPKPKRTIAGLRDGLFNILDKLEAGIVDTSTAKAYANTAMTIVKSLEVQLEYERMKLAKEIPANVGDFSLVPALENK